MIKFTSAVLGLLVFASAAHAQMGGMGEQQAFVPDVDEESLILLRPDKWYPYFSESEQKVDTYYFPTGQKPEKWKEALQSQRYRTTLGVTDAAQVQQARTQANKANCMDHQVTFVTGGTENGYSKNEWTEVCTSNSDSTLVTLNKVILGNEQLYSVSKIWKYEPKASDMEEWRQYLSQVYVCDPTTGANPCRSPNGGRGRGGPR